MGVNARPEEVSINFAGPERERRWGRKCRVRSVGAVVLTRISEVICESLEGEGGDWKLYASWMPALIQIVLIVGYLVVRACT